MLTMQDLKERLEKSPVTYTKLADALGVPTKRLQRIRSGEHIPDIELAARIVTTLKALEKAAKAKA